MSKAITIYFEKRGCLTNGDVIKALFPNLKQDNERLIQQYGSQALYDTFEKWCELPYKGGSK